MKEKIIQYAQKLNIEYVGVAPVREYDDLREKLERRRKKYTASQFEEKDTDIRCNPKLSYPWAKSIIVCLFPYYTGEDEGSNISKYARIPDYHKVAKNKLTLISEYIVKEIPNAKTLCFADTGVLHDRYLAYLAGLGFMGCNTMLINEKYGTYFFIGYIVTDLELEADKPQDKKCKLCGKCISACPGKALDGEFLDCEKCVSYITQLKEITDTQAEILKKQDKVYGCDKCQEVCPHNENPVLTPIKEFYKKRVVNLNRTELFNMSNREFKEKYNEFPFSWRGKAVILKNFDK